MKVVDFLCAGPINTGPTLDQTMALYRAGNKSLTEPMMTQFTDAYIFVFCPDELNA